MTDVKEWSRLGEVLSRVMEATGVTEEEAKYHISGAIADGKIRIRFALFQPFRGLVHHAGGDPHDPWIPISSGNLVVSLPEDANALVSNVSLTNTGTFFDGPSIAQGTSGTWLAAGQVLLEDTAGAANFNCKLWDGTTVIASGHAVATITSEVVQISLSGILASPAANIRISCVDATSTSGEIEANATGQGKDSVVSATRIQ